MKKTINLVILILLISLISLPVNAQGQDWKIWTVANISAELGKKWDIRVAYINSTNTNFDITQPNFNWYSGRANYQINKYWNVQFGTAWLILPSKSITTNRIFARLIHRTVIDNRFIIRNSIHLENHNENEKRFDHRVILGSRLSLKKRTEFLKIAPSIAYQLFFNIGGNPIRYFNEVGEEIAYQPSLGFHRGRFTINLNKRIAPPLTVSLFYFNQHEFNLGLTENRGINIQNPNTGKTQRPFNNNNTMGISLNYNISKSNPLPKNARKKQQDLRKYTKKFN